MVIDHKIIFSFSFFASAISPPEHAMPRNHPAFHVLPLWIACVAHTIHHNMYLYPPTAQITHWANGLVLYNLSYKLL